MAPVPLGDRIYKRVVTRRIGSARIYKRPVRGDGIYKRLVTRGIGSTSS
jgi:hypothetical protein